MPEGDACVTPYAASHGFFAMLAKNSFEHIQFRPQKVDLHPQVLGQSFASDDWKAANGFFPVRSYKEEGLHTRGDMLRIEVEGQVPLFSFPILNRLHFRNDLIIKHDANLWRVIAVNAAEQPLPLTSGHTYGLNCQFAHYYNLLKLGAWIAAECDVSYHDLVHFGIFKDEVHPNIPQPLFVQIRIGQIKFDHGVLFVDG